MKALDRRPDALVRVPPFGALLAASVFATMLLLAPAAGAAAKKHTSAKPQAGESVYRCKDSNGQSYFGQAIPPECMDVDVEVLDATGRVVRMIPGRKSLDQIARQQADEQARAASAQRDRTLLATYLSVADIERLRDQRIELLEQQSVVTRQYIANLRNREARLMASAQRFRPYSTNPKAPPLAEQVASEIVNTVKGLRVYEQELTKNTTERERVAGEFASDIARFKELRGTR